MGATPRLRVPVSPRPQMQGGLNENYARELLELHTLGVDGGYTQKDVTELARLLTGWSIARPHENSRSGFLFRAALHDNKPKTILGKKFPTGGGLAEGEEMIRLLARHPSTARHIATKLCQRLVADDPPAPLVDRVAKRFLDSGGDLRETVRAVLTSPEFFDPRFYRAKVKSPFEYVISAVRAIDGSTKNPLALVRVLRDMGQPLYFAQPPTGYSDEAEAWVNTGALMSRLNFALALAASKVPNTNVTIEPGTVDALAARLVSGELGAETRRVIAERLASEAVANASEEQKAQLTAGLILGSPEFQRQ